MTRLEVDVGLSETQISTRDRSLSRRAKHMGLRALQPRTVSPQTGGLESDRRGAARRLGHEAPAAGHHAIATSRA
eukprot:1550339-Pyramimonas_sp.AAC.1